MDLLVRLYALPSAAEHSGNGVVIRRAFAAEKRSVSDFVAQHFSQGWASECEIAFARQPLACFVAVTPDAICGFGCYDATARGFFGPIGVSEPMRGRGLGTALLLATLHDMRASGYGYAVVGATDDPGFYRAAGAIQIPDSTPGFYSGMLRS
jgi:GNAT superfamily N-acetyltransferase